MPSDTAPRVLARLRAGEAYDRFTRWTELPMLALSVVFLAVLVIPVLDETLPAGRLEARSAAATPSASATSSATIHNGIPGPRT